MVACRGGGAGGIGDCVEEEGFLGGSGGIFDDPSSERVLLVTNGLFGECVVVDLELSRR